MMSTIWVVILLALTWSQCGGLPVRPDYPHDGTTYVGWGAEASLYVMPVLALVVIAVVLFGCTWCYRHKDCKPDEGTDNQLFTASAQQLHAAQRALPPDSGFSEPANNNVSEDNNNGPISLREMQNIANNNAAAYIVTENEERNRVSRESVVEFEPLPAGIIGVDPLERCADWFGVEDFPRNNLQYLREIGRGWFGRVVEGEVEEAGASTTVAVKILNQNATLEDKARFLDEAKMYRDVTHANILAFVGKCLQEDPWILMFELCSIDLQQYLIVNRPKMAILNENGVPLRLMCDISSALAYLHSRGYTYGRLWGGSVLVREGDGDTCAVLGCYSDTEPQHDCLAPEVRQGQLYTASSEIWSLGALIWQVCSWGSIPTGRPSPPPDLPCPYKNHLYQVMQLCWNGDPNARPTAAQVHALIAHLQATHAAERAQPQDHAHFEDRWQRLKPNTIPKIDEHIAIVHVPSNARFNVEEFDHNTLGIDTSGAVSRSSSIMSDRDPLASNVKSESLTNLHGSLDDVRNIYLTHNETAALECHQGNIHLEDNREKEHDRSDASMDPWLKDVIAGSQDDVSYYKDVSDVIKNLDNILNSEKTSSSESSHQASPSRDNLTLDCKKELPMQKSLVKSPGITNFQNVVDTGFDVKMEEGEPCVEDEVDRDTIGTLSHSFERHSDSTSQHTLENLTPDTPIRDFEVFIDVERLATEAEVSEIDSQFKTVGNVSEGITAENETESVKLDVELPKEIVEIDVPELKELYVVSMPQHTLENLTPDNPMGDFEVFIDVERLATEAEVSEIDSQIRTVENVSERITIENEKESVKLDVELPKEIVEIDVPELKELYVVSMPSVSDTEISPRKDCQTPCDNVTEIRTENETKSINNVKKVATDGTPLEVIEVTDSVENYEQVETSKQEVILPVLADKTTISNEGFDTLPSVTEDVSTTQDNETSLVKLEDIGPESIESENNYSKDETILISDLADTVTDSSKDDDLRNRDGINIDVNVDIEAVPIEQTPVSVQNIIEDVLRQEPDLKQMKNADSAIVKLIDITPTHLPPAIVQNTENDATVLETENLVSKEYEEEGEVIEKLDTKNSEANIKSPRSDSVVFDMKKRSGDSSEYMDLINDTNSQILKYCNVDNSIREIDVKENLATDTDTVDDSIPNKNDSTQYLDLPSFNMIKRTSDFLQMELMIAGNNGGGKLVSSTPIGSDKSGDILDSFEVGNEEKTIVVSETMIPLCESGASGEQKYVTDNISPYESPSHKSLQTDTYDENSSVVLGPFEKCTTDMLKGVKPSIDPVELPREELLAFSSNFSEMNLETPSPLRDGNFLNEVPDISPDVLFDDIASISEPKADNECPSDDTETDSGTQKYVLPSTPPNSIISLASTSQDKYLVGVDLRRDVPEPDSIDLNQIELQITSKLAIAENENNLNIEYSGPLTVEGLIEEGGAMRESDAMPELYLAGNGGSVEDVRELLSLNEECVQALRNELELKLPLAQVATIEPAVEADVEWVDELPPPPEVVLSYLGALSPIQEETGQQLSAYENDIHWNTSTRTDSSESYPEPCNNSTDSATSLPRGDTYTVASRDMNLAHTHPTAAPDEPQHSSREITMSVDSLNGSPYKCCAEPNPLSPIDDRTYMIDDRSSTNEDEHESCERISQVSPFLVSPTTDTETGDNATRVSTLSRTTLPTDAKHSKPSDTQCLSKATSIDSWCSNDTLYNVEENFDDLAMDADLLAPEDEEKSESTDTLTHDEDREPSHCSTYLIHDSKSEPCDTFSPDSITANRNDTYTNLKPEVATTLSGHTGFEDSKNTQTTDLAYGTLIPGMPSFSNCSLEDGWQRPELVRRSPMGDYEMSPPKHSEEDKHEANPTPQLTERRFSEMGSMEITCLRDHSTDSPRDSDTGNRNILTDFSPKFNIAGPTQTSTPVVEPSADVSHVEGFSCDLPEIEVQNSELSGIESVLKTFQVSDDVKSQNQIAKEPALVESYMLLADIVPNQNKSSFSSSELTLNYSEFENRVACKPQGKIDLVPSLNHIHESSVDVKLQDKAIFKYSPNPSELKNTAACKPQHEVSEYGLNDSELPSTSKAYNLYDKVDAECSSINSAHCKSQDRVSEPPDIAVSECTYCDVDNSPIYKPEVKIVTESSFTYSDFENSAACKPQDKTILEQSATYSDFENSAARKPQEMVASEHSPTFSDFEYSACTQQDKIVSKNSTTYSDFEISATTKPQDKAPTEMSSQSVESGVTSEGFRSFENSVKGRPQDLNSMINASLWFLNSERMYGADRSVDFSSVKNPNSVSTNDNNETMEPVHPPSIMNLIESHEFVDTREPSSSFLINFNIEDETEQPHSIIITEVPMSSNRISPNKPYDSHGQNDLTDASNVHQNKSKFCEETLQDFYLPKMNGESHDQPESILLIEHNSQDNQSIINHNSKLLVDDKKVPTNDISSPSGAKVLTNGSAGLPINITVTQKVSEELHTGGSEKFATMNFLNETFEELVESSVDDSDSKDDKLVIDESPVPEIPSDEEDKALESSKDSLPTSTTESQEEQSNVVTEAEGRITAVTEDFLQNEKKHATLDVYFPMLRDIRFTGPGSEMMSTSFQDSPTSPNSPECEQDSKPSTVAEIMKEWDSDSESHSSNSSSGEFIWKDGAGHEVSVVPSTHFDHQRGSAGPGAGGGQGSGGAGDAASGASEGSGDSGSGSEGDEVEFVPSSWDCRAAPAKSSLRSLEQATPESKKRVVFKRQKYHCVYEYPREAADGAPHSPAYLPDLSTYCEWDPTSAEEAELCYGQLFASPSALAGGYPLRVPLPFGADYDEDFFITSSARPFESLGIMSTTSQFFPGGMHGKRALLERSLSDEGVGFPAPPPPATIPTAPSLDFTTPDSGVEDITPGSTLELDFDTKKTDETPWRPTSLDSGSSSESVSPSSPSAGGELGGLRHTRDRLKLDLPPSPHAPSPRHNRVFNFSAPKRRGDTPIVMSDDTPVASGALPLPEDETPPVPEPTFSTFGKSAPRLEPEQKIILTDEAGDAETDTAVKAEGTVLDSGDEDSGIESSSKATLERNAPNVS